MYTYCTKLCELKKMPDIDFIKIEYIFPSGYLHFYFVTFLDAVDVKQKIKRK